jgi:single-stranded-DNA-specific exonuclease
MLEKTNESRKQETYRVLAEATEIVEAQGLQEKRLILVAKEDWHLGILGIVAGRIRERYNRPTFVVAIDDAGMWKGSGRSIDAFHLADAIRAHPDLMGGGGHAKAAGCHFAADNLEAVRAALEEYAAQALTDEDLVPVCEADVAVSANEVTPNLFRDVQAMEPCGMGNPTARFFASGKIAELKETRTPEHWQIALQTEDGRSPFLTAFGLRTQYPDLKPGTRANLGFTIKTEEWQGRIQTKWSFEAIEIDPAA